MKKISYKIFSPGGNTTALVYDKTSASKCVNIAKKIMRNPKIEQVGFVSKKYGRLRLNMMGGEFCGNAARCLIFEQAGTSKRTVKLQVSGFPRILQGRRNKNNVELSLPASFLRKISKVKEGDLVELYGISFLLSAKSFKQNKLKKLINKYVGNSPAMGIVSYRQAGPNSYSIVPWVWVKKTNSLIKETSCSSGSIALAWLKNLENGQNRLSITQPSGSKFKVTILKSKNRFTKIKLDGQVKQLGTKVIF